MNNAVYRGAALFLLLMLCGCTGVPPFYDTTWGQGSDVSVNDVVNHIKCELYTAAKDSALGSYDGHGLNDFEALVVVNLKVDDSGNLTPSTTFLQPYTAMTNRSLAINLQYGETRERTFTQGYLFDVAEIAGDSFACDPSVPGTANADVDLVGPNLRGDLGLKEIAKIGLGSLKTMPKGVKPALFGTGGGYIQPTQPTAPGCDPTIPTLAFGSSMQFVLTKGIGGGPSWTLTHFKFGSAGGSGGGGSASGGGGSGSSGSSSGGSGGPLSITRMDTDQLWITFALNAKKVHDEKKEVLQARINDLQPKVDTMDARSQNHRLNALSAEEQTLLGEQRVILNQSKIDLANEPKAEAADDANTKCALHGGTTTMILQNL